eukprot:TRINITY_DN3473_c0_g1_i1.p2 TRINITY_DN3473_c0_g1~~TRINITY_DN3473_c0_g1_i1.p2  ORF type:complete len:53 (+),score=8.93 TRINITY_DN3473_c0_g1_i1:821-979(+)
MNNVHFYLFFTKAADDNQPPNDAMIVDSVDAPVVEHPQPEANEISSRSRNCS